MILRHSRGRATSPCGFSLVRGWATLRSLCNEYEQQIAYDAYCRMMQQLELGTPTHQTELDLRQAAGVKINDLAPVMCAAGNVIELASMRFQLPAFGAARRPGVQFSLGRQAFRQSEPMPDTGLGLL